LTQNCPINPISSRHLPRLNVANSYLSPPERPEGSPYRFPTPARFFTNFRASLAGGDTLDRLREGLIGKDALVYGPFDPQPMLYVDYVASGRALRQVEMAVMDGILPYCANSHTEASYCGAHVTALRRAARAEVARICGAAEAGAVIYGGSGATAGLNRLVHLFGLREAVAEGRGATVLHGPYEHHSNILPWRESGAEVIEIPEAAEGGPDLAALDAALARARRVHPDGLIVGTFSAASNVTGILTVVAEVTRRLKAAGALSVWDYACGGPYLPMTLDPASDAPAGALCVGPVARLPGKRLGPGRGGYAERHRRHRRRAGADRERGGGPGPDRRDRPHARRPDDRASGGGPAPEAAWQAELPPSADLFAGDRAGVRRRRPPPVCHPPDE
jgi:hypothetical protein